ncbi:hypothetical protein U1Q18_035896 [Sarracenia purpurea var. burkii]
MRSDCNPSKPHYDLSMSKRTRKPLNLEREADDKTAQITLKPSSLEREADDQMAQITLKQGSLDIEAGDQMAQIPIKPRYLERESPTDHGINKEEKEDEKEEEEEEEEKSSHEGEDSGHKSLKQLIKGRNSLEEHFTEEEQKLQLVVKRQHRVDFKKLVSRCSRVLSRLIEVKREPRVGYRNKPTLRFTM